MLEGLVVNKTLRGLMARSRHLVLTDKPRLIFIDPIKMTLKGEIELDDKVSVRVRSNGKSFDLLTSKRVYRLRDVMGAAQRWTDAIEEAISRRT